MKRAGGTSERVADASRKDEVPEIPTDAAVGCDIISDLRYDIDRIYGSREPISLEQYGSICSSLHQADEALTLISSKATDHHCAPTDAIPVGFRGQAEDWAGFVATAASEIQAATRAIDGEVGDGKIPGVRRAYKVIDEALRSLNETAAMMRMYQLKITMYDTAPQAAE